MNWVWLMLFVGLGYGAVVWTQRAFGVRGHLFFMPTWPVYPDSEEEAATVAQYTNFRTVRDELFFRATDVSVVPAFVDVVPESSDELEWLTKQLLPVIVFLKLLYNRPRPYLLDKHIWLMESATANSPAYPSGHAMQAFYLAKVLSRRHPEKRDQLYEIAERCRQARVNGGVHYPSDGEFGRQLIEKYF